MGESAHRRDLLAAQARELMLRGTSMMCIGALEKFAHSYNVDEVRQAKRPTVIRQIERMSLSHTMTHLSEYDGPLLP